MNKHLLGAIVSIVALLVVFGTLFSNSASAQTPPPCYGNGCSPPPPQVCTMQQSTGACVFLAGQMGIPANYTVGIAHLSYDSCTGETWYGYGCMPLPPQTQLPALDLVTKIFSHRYQVLSVSKVRSSDSTKKQVLDVGSKDYTISMSYTTQDQYGAESMVGQVVSVPGTARIYADLDDKNMVVVVLTLSDVVEVKAKMFVDSVGDMSGTATATLKDILGRTTVLFDGFASMPLSTPPGCVTDGPIVDCTPVTGGNGGGGGMGMPSTAP